MSNFSKGLTITMLKVVKKDKLIFPPKPTAMLDYFKIILVKVSFDIKLFEKELKKALKSLVEKEIEDLRNWCYSKFGKTHQPVLEKCFKI